MPSTIQKLKPTVHIETINIPDLSNQHNDTLSKYVENDGVYFNDWTPDGQSIIVRKRVNNTHQAFLISKANANPDQLTDFNDPVTRIRSINTKSDNGFIFGLDEGGNENDQIYYYNLYQRKAKLITDGKSKNGFWTWANTSNQFAFCSNKRNNVDFDIYVCKQINTTQFEIELIIELEGNWHIINWSFDDQFLIISKYISNNETEPYLLNLATKKLIKINQGYSNGD